ncbi:MAG: ribokinase [Acidimicrobiales bacterium]
MAPPPDPAVVVFGSLNLDHVITVERLPGPGETVSGDRYMAVPGGKGLNQAVTASRQGARVAMVCCVGDDAPGQLLLGVLSREGVGATWARVVPGTPSGTALITVARGGANTIVVAAGANGRLSTEDAKSANQLLGPGMVVLTQLEVPSVSVLAMLQLARARKATTVLNPSPAPLAVPRELLGLVDVLVANEGEALAMGGEATTEGAAAQLCAQGCGSVVVTLGEHGALVTQGGQSPVNVPTYRVEAKDTTAAGDAFCGTLAAALADGCDLVAAARRGCAAGALATTATGALPSLPTAAQVQRLLASGAG